MDDITVVVAQVKTVVVPENEVDLKNTHFLYENESNTISSFSLFDNVNMCYFRVTTRKNKRGMIKALLLWLHSLNKMIDQELA